MELLLFRIQQHADKHFIVQDKKVNSYQPLTNFELNSYFLVFIILCDNYKEIVIVDYVYINYVVECKDDFEV